jgi:hypothetical protein
MPLYVFRTDDGDEHVRHFSIAEAPDDITLDDGTVAKRIISWDGGFALRGKGWASKPERERANRKWGPQ